MDNPFSSKAYETFSTTCLTPGLIGDVGVAGASGHMINKMVSA
jgi:hypothetical protein